ncbi:hypothetical protein ACFQ15_15030 [Sphingomonas hankookensis]|nr:hypothetical protein [Sphingomonas hankookensis]
MHTRIAIANMLLEQAKPVLRIVDDPPVYSGDGRLAAMVEVSD